MIPPLDTRGLLPEGVHDAGSFAEVAEAFAVNEPRRQMLASLLCWLDTEAREVLAGLELFIGGSYLSTKHTPADIDCTVIVPSWRIAGAAAVTTEAARARTLRVYGVDFHATIPTKNDFTFFFQFVGQNAPWHGCSATDMRGVVRVVNWESRA